MDSSKKIDVGTQLFVSGRVHTSCEMELGRGSTGLGFYIHRFLSTHIVMCVTLAPDILCRCRIFSKGNLPQEPSHASSPPCVGIRGDAQCLPAPERFRNVVPAWPEQDEATLQLLKLALSSHSFS